MNKLEMEHEIINTLCKNNNKTDSYTSIIQDKVREKTEQQLQYVLSPINKNVFLEACAGSGKTEVVGMKTAYEISKWNFKNKGIAVLTFTNEATDTIKERVGKFSGLSSMFPHYIGTLSAFIHGFISQSFGYKFFKHKNRDGDKSYRLVDKNLEVFDNHWLKKYKLPYTNNNAGRHEFYANQIYFDNKINDVILYQSETKKTPLKEFYNSSDFQKFVNDYREKSGKKTALGYEYIKEQIAKVKNSFYEDGFANFEDINNIALRILKRDSKITELLASRFPIILVDECQDLSWVEINILNEFKKAGTILHFIGDLNQSIYEFKNANPEITKAFLSDFDKYRLTDNFRSCHPIVELSNKLLGITLPVRGLGIDKIGERSISYLEYSDISVVTEQYQDFLNGVNISYEKSAILVRQQNLKQELEINQTESKHLLLDALQLWLQNTPTSQMLALELAGKQMQKWFGGSKTKKNYYCPNVIESAFQWRIFLKNFLEGCLANDCLINVGDIEYSLWYKNFNACFLTTIEKAYQSLADFDLEKRDFNTLPKLRTPSGTAKNKIVIFNSKNNSNMVPINTIHSAKGKDFESVMVVSSRRTSGSGGHWKHWLEKELESGRIGYVANTRAKYSLVWAVPNLKTEEQALIESFGFKRIASSDV
ncbi:UvrD-helicase domain-containing protein [Paenibacillus sonchi]|uniref:UvrD-helicase domain-containing protein n=1 Tax=Paenibacillus sonchi TaxID=373687 RepID=UPI001E65188D|nr:DEAD/DEAH box helicase [Paenibacillus sonchi]MCE3202457.1 DEAD/DEAH box helicase [Paenibacillus sonchi]